MAFSVFAGDPATTCGWCATNAFDTTLRRALLWHDALAAARLSHALSLTVLPSLALVGIVGPALRARRPRVALQDLAIVLCAFTLTTGVADGVKKLFDRERPGFHFGRAASLEAAHVPLERFLSFFSGDTAWAFMFVAVAATLARQRNYGSARLLAVVGVPLAAGVALLRIGADMHWATDVLTGALVGAAIGVALPAWVHPRVIG